MRSQIVSRSRPLFLAWPLHFFACLVILFGWEAVSSQPRPIGDVTLPIERTQNGVSFKTTSGAAVSISLYTDHVVRVRIAPSGIFERDRSYALAANAQRRKLLYTVKENGGKLAVDASNGLKVFITLRPFGIEVVDINGAAVLQDDIERPTSFNTATGDITTTMRRRSEVETYYGFGEKAFLEMSRNGKVIANWNTDTFSYPVGTDPIYQSIPFFYGLHDGKAFGIFLNNTFRTVFDMGKTIPDRYTFGSNGGELDYFVFTGGKDRTPKKILADYSDLTGRMPLPPIWALGNQQSRWSYFPEKRVREIAEGFRSNRIPADVLYLDIDYMNGYRVFTWDKTRFPDPKKLIGDLRNNGFRTVIIIDPGIKVDPNYSVYSEGRRAGHFVKNPDGTELNRDVWPKASAFPDFTDPKARLWFGSLFQGHLDEGIAGFWTDMNEPGVFVTPETERPEVFHHPEKTFPYDTPHVGDGMPGTHRRYHNVYGMLMARATFEGLKSSSPGTRPFVLTRAGFAGVQRYSAVWTGDNVASWDHLALTIPMLANMSVSGVPLVGADVGGFNDMPSGELYTRWLQAAALTPFLRSHSVGWVGKKEPWEYGDPFTAINRASIELRYQLLPYIYTLFRQHESDGSPVMRPLWYEFPADKATYLINDQYMLGSDILVAPVVKEGMRTRGIYLPVGAEWIDWWTGETFESGKTHYLAAPLDRLPLFVRVGAIVPTQATIQHTGEMRLAEMTINVAAGTGRSSTGTLYQDQGEGYSNKADQWSMIRFEFASNKLTIAREGGFAGQRIARVVIHGLTSKPSSVAADGTEVPFNFDAVRKRLEFGISGSETEIKITH